MDTPEEFDEDLAHGQHTTKYQSNLVPWPIRVFYCVSAVGRPGPEIRYLFTIYLFIQQENEKDNKIVN